MVHRRMSRGHAESSRGDAGCDGCRHRRRPEADCRGRHPSQPTLKFLTAPPADIYRAGGATHSQRGRPSRWHGEIGAILRRRGLYSSALGEWRRQRGGGNSWRPDTGEAWAEIAPSQSAGHRTGLCTKGKRLARRCLERAEAIIEVQKNLPIYWESSWRRSRQRSCATTRPDRRVSIGDAGQGHSFGHLCSACRSRASLQRSTKRQSRPPTAPLSRPSPARALPAGSRQTVLDLLRSPRFADLAPAEIYATLLDEGVYHCSVSTMYRRLAANNEVLVRRKQLRHPIYTKPELLAVGPNEVWSWDITKLKGPAKWDLLLPLRHHRHL